MAYYASGLGLRASRNQIGGAVDRTQCEIVVDMLPVENHEQYTYTADAQAERWQTAAGTGGRDMSICLREPVFKYCGDTMCHEEGGYGYGTTSSTRVWASAVGMPKSQDWAVAGVSNGEIDVSDGTRDPKLINIQVRGLTTVDSNSYEIFLPGDKVYAELIEDAPGTSIPDPYGRGRLRPCLRPGTSNDRKVFDHPLQIAKQKVDSIVSSLGANNVDGLAQAAKLEIKTLLGDETKFDAELDVKVYGARLDNDVQTMIHLAETDHLRTLPQVVGSDSALCDRIEEAYRKGLYYFLLRFGELETGGVNQKTLKFVKLFGAQTNYLLSFVNLLIDAKRKRCLGTAMNYCDKGKLTILLGSS